MKFSLLFQEEYETCFLHYLDQVCTASQYQCADHVYTSTLHTLHVKIDNESPE